MKDNLSPREEIHEGLRKGVVAGDVVPVVVGSSTMGVGIHTLLDMIYDYLPTPVEMSGGEFVGTNPNDDKPAVRRASDDEHLSAFVFKTFVDPFVGKISLFKVYSGVFRKDADILKMPIEMKLKKSAHSSSFVEKHRRVWIMWCRRYWSNSKTPIYRDWDTLCERNHPIVYEGYPIPKPCLYMAIEPKAQGDEEKNWNISSPH